MAVLGWGHGLSAGGKRWRRAALLTLVLPVLTMWRGPDARASQDPLFLSQWSLTQLHVPAAWARSTGSGVRIGIVDSGVQGGHEDLMGKVVDATDCLNTGGDAQRCNGSGVDDTGHGTDMAGIAAATKDNGRGIAGVAPDASLVVAKVLTDDGGSITDVEAGIRWVVAHGARVVNLSLGDNPNAQLPVDLSFQQAIEEAWTAGAVPVVAAGNPNALGPGRESFADLDALVVGATDRRADVAPYSNPLTSAKWGVVAPGGSGTGDSRDVISTWWDATAPAAMDRYSSHAGSSVAVAHVSGVVALLLAEGLSRDEAVARIVETARPIGCGVGCHGLVDAAAAVDVNPPLFEANAASRALVISPRGRATARASSAAPAATARGSGRSVAATATSVNAADGRSDTTGVPRDLGATAVAAPGYHVRSTAALASIALVLLALVAAGICLVCQSAVPKPPPPGVKI